MSDSRIILPGALAPGSEIARVYEEILRGEQAHVGEDAQAAQWSGEARAAAAAAQREIEEALPDGWQLRKTEGPGGFEVYNGLELVPVSLSSSLTMASKSMHVASVLSVVNRHDKRRRP